MKQSVIHFFDRGVSFLTRVLDYFIKDRASLSEDDFHRKRFLVGILLFAVLIDSYFTILSMVGILKAEVNLFHNIPNILCLIAYKRYSKDAIPVLYFSTMGTLILAYYIMEMGYVHNLLNKWYLLVLIVILFTKAKWAFPYLLIIIINQVFFYFYATGPEGIPETGRLEELMDNLGFYLITYFLFRLLYNFTVSKTKSLNKSKELLARRTNQLLQSNEELERFAYIASHDLKTPLRNIISFSMLLEKELEKNEYQKGKEYLGYIKDSSQKLNKLIKDVLHFSRISANKLEEEEIVDTAQIALEVQDLIGNYLKEKNGKIIINDDLPLIRTQRTIMLILFKNIIENGLKYNDSPNPQVEISFEHLGCSGVLSFADNGIGIHHKYHNSIFEMFSRLHAENKYEGSGLGLAFCKKIMDNLGGKIQLISKPKRGSTFELVFDKELIYVDENIQVPISQNQG